MPLAAHTPPEALRADLVGRRIHLWSVPLDPPDAEVAALRHLLSADEIARADRFHFDRHRRRFIVGRGVLRRLLGRYLGREAASIRFVYGEKGKPALAEPPADGPLHFNLSNSHELALVGFDREREIGVDVEHLRPMDDLAAIAERFFSAAESEELLALPRERQVEGFFNCWTRKEAYLKAVGDGLSAPLNRFDVTLRPGEAPRMLRLEGSAERAQGWSLHHLRPATGYIGAVCIEEQEWELELTHWPGLAAAGGR